MGISAVSRLVYPPGPTWPAANKSMADQAFDLVNQHRVSIGKAPYGTLASLVASAEWKARHMAMYEYPLNHDDPAPPVSRTWIKRLNDNGYPSEYAAENIAEFYATAQQVVAGWLASQAHLENIESSYWVVAGMGCAIGTNGEVYWCQDFGAAIPPPVPPTPPPTPPPPIPINVGSKWANKKTGKVVTVTLVTENGLRVTYHGPAKNAKSVSKPAATFRSLFDHKTG